MGLNSEPLPENEALLKLIDAGIDALEQGDGTPLELDVAQLLKGRDGKPD